MQTGNDEKLEIRCSTDTLTEFIKTKANIGPKITHEEALQELIETYREQQVSLRDNV